MSPLYDSWNHWIPLAVLFASLAGSTHCIGMCGGLVAASANSKTTWIAYHLGRLLGYLSLGALAGALGTALHISAEHSSLWATAMSWGAAIFLGVSLLVTGVHVWRNRPLHFSIVPPMLLSRLFRMSSNHAWLNGLLTAFLPCGWLHSFLLGALATRSAVLGAGFLFVFWLGTLPALGLAPWMIQQVFKPISRRAPKLAALILISAGVFSIGLKMAPLAAGALYNAPTKTPHAHCH